MLTNRDEIIILVLRNLSEKHVFRLILSLISSKLRIFSLKSPFWYSKIMFFRAKSVIHNYSEMLCQTYNIIFRSFGQSHFRSKSFSIFFSETPSTATTSLPPRSVLASKSLKHERGEFIKKHG